MSNKVIERFELTMEQTELGGRKYMLKRYNLEDKINNELIDLGRGEYVNYHQFWYPRGKENRGYYLSVTDRLGGMYHDPCFNCWMRMGNESNTAKHYRVKVPRKSPVIIEFTEEDEMEKDYRNKWVPKKL